MTNRPSHSEVFQALMRRSATFDVALALIIFSIAIIIAIIVLHWKPWLGLNLLFSVIIPVAAVLLSNGLSDVSNPILRIEEWTSNHVFRFENSVRLYLRVWNYGKTMAKNVVGYLTVTVNVSNQNNKGTLLVPKSRLMQCKAVVEEFGKRLRPEWEYLVPEGSPTISADRLPWDTPISAGKGLSGKEYAHLTNIPSDGNAKLLLMDVYRTRNGKYVLRIFSEYGTEDYPRAVIVLDPNDSNIESLEFEVTVSAESYLIADKVKITLQHYRDENKSDFRILYNGQEKTSLSELLNGIKEIECDLKGQEEQKPAQGTSKPS